MGSMARMQKMSMKQTILENPMNERKGNVAETRDDTDVQELSPDALIPPPGNL